MSDRPHTIELFGKAGCHLCEAVLQTILRVKNQVTFDLKLRDIEGDAFEFYERYKEHIPVVLLDGREIARYRLSESELRHALQAADREES